MSGSRDQSGSDRGIAVLLSGGGRTMLNLVDAIERGALRAEVRVVIASKHCVGAEKALGKRLPTLVVPGVIDPLILSRILRDHGASWIVLAGYLKLLRIPAGYEGRALNIHPALLPSFGGGGMYGMRVHRAVLEAGCKVSGCTVHFCDEVYDRGPIVAQRACEVRDDDTPESLAARVFELECEVYPWAIGKLLDGKVKVEDGRARVVE